MMGTSRFRWPSTTTDARSGFWNRYATNFGVDPVGRDVEVLVNPAEPSQAVVSKGQSRPEVAGVGFLVFGVVAMVIGVNMVR